MDTRGSADECHANLDSSGNKIGGKVIAKDRLIVVGHRVAAAATKRGNCEFQIQIKPLIIEGTNTNWEGGMDTEGSSSRVKSCALITWGPLTQSPRDCPFKLSRWCN